MFENIVLHALWIVLTHISPIDLQTLANGWDRTNPNQVERAYCATMHLGVFQNKQNPKDLNNGVAIAMIDSGSVKVAPVDTLDAKPTPYSVSVDCADDDSTFIIHTHTPTTCAPEGGCSLGGFDAYSCQPSDGDLVTTAHRVLKIAGVQCDTYAVVLFAPVIKRPPPKKRGKKVLHRVNLGVTARQGSGNAWRRPNNRQPSR